MSSLLRMSSKREYPNVYEMLQRISQYQFAERQPIGGQPVLGSGVSLEAT